MAGRLQDDKIRWVLSLDAKGVQGELVQLSSSINQLKQNNSDLEKEMKKAQKAMDDAEKAMIRLEDAGKTNTKQYQYATESYHSNSAALVELKSKIEQNNKAIKEGNAKFEELKNTLQVNDMTMNQLRQRASDLQKQLNNTSASTNPEAYKKLQKELTQVNDRMFVVQNAGKSMLSTFASMHNPVGGAARAVQGFIQVLNFLAKHPIIAVIALIIGLFMKLKDALFKNEEAMNAINRIMAPLKAAFDAIVKVLQEVVIWVLKFVEGFLAGLSKLIEKIPFLNKYLGEINEKAKEAVQLEKDKQALQQKHRENLVENAKKENQIAKLRDEATRKDLHSATERIELLKEAIRLEDEIVKTKIEEAKEELRLLEIEAARTENAKEMNDKIAEQKALIIGLETEFYQKTKRDQRALSSAILETQHEAVEAAKKALENRLKNEENALNQQINQLKQSRLQGVITEKEYNKEVERLTIESLNRKINIKGQEKDKILQLEAQLLDAQIKQQTEADKELLEALTKDHEEKLQLLDKSKNKALEILQEQETDQKMYALRAAEIEAQFSRDRLDTILAFGASVEQAEFANAKLREDAIKANGKEIIDAESKNLAEQEKLRKLFARTTADFERQYNIKTWEQRKDDELRIIERQHEAGLLSEETYQLALKVIEKKYEDEKLRIREQYGIASMKELYDSEMELLLEQHEKGLLEEEDYQKALLNLKLKYAQESAGKLDEFSKIGSDTVKAFAEAETATLSAEYTKRQSALTEQFNQGIIAQEDYNAQKEQLDYEEKSKELEIQKKYADVNFAIQAAEIISSGAVAAINAFKSLSSIPIVGTVLGAAAAALVAVTTAMRLKQSKAERDRVKAMTLQSPGGGGGAPRTGQIRVREGFAEGGYNMSDGGYTGDGGKHEVAGYLPVHGGEYVIAKDELQQPKIMNMARSIERERRKRTNKNAVSGFADGGSNDPNGIDTASIGENVEMMGKMLALLERLESGDITVQTNYGITEMEAEQRRKMEVEDKFTRES